jgi:hypothetical protein
MNGARDRAIITEPHNGSRMMTPDRPETTRAPLDNEALKAVLQRRGHAALSWDEIAPATLPNGVVTAMYRVGMPDQDTSPTIFKVRFPPGCFIEAHTHACDYSEIILEGSQKVGNQWYYPGDIRIGLANRGYGPLVAGPDGATVLFIFADGRWPAITLGNNDGSTLNVDVIQRHLGAR